MATKEYTKSRSVKIGDFVAVQYEHGDPITAVVTDPNKALHQLNGFSITPEVRERVIADPNPYVIAIRRSDNRTDMVFLEQCRKLTKKELFKIKLQGDWRGLFS